jgi:murein DD-endopeptidase MepM/ murein hydrolase activator NlpD
MNRVWLLNLIWLSAVIAAPLAMAAPGLTPVAPVTNHDGAGDGFYMDINNIPTDFMAAPAAEPAPTKFGPPPTNIDLPSQQAEGTAPVDGQCDGNCPKPLHHQGLTKLPEPAKPKKVAKALAPQAVAAAQTPRFSAGGYILPVEGRINHRRGVQMVRDPWSGRRYMHTGQDIISPYGSAVQAAAAGKVVRVVNRCYDRPSAKSRRCGGGLGNYVEIRHPDGKSTIYAHLENTRHCSPIAQLRPGMTVAQGQAIACVGASGRATGAHLFVRMLSPSGRVIDPMHYMK